MERLEDSGILARYSVRVTKPLPATLELQEWVPADEETEVPYPTMAGWLDVIRGVGESREMMRQIVAENDDEGEN